MRPLWVTAVIALLLIAGLGSLFLVPEGDLPTEQADLATGQADAAGDPAQAEAQLATAPLDDDSPTQGADPAPSDAGDASTEPAGSTQDGGANQAEDGQGESPQGESSNSEPPQTAPAPIPDPGDVILRYSLAANQVRLNYDWGVTAQQVFWDFGDGSGGQGETADHTYASLGSYDIRVTVHHGAHTSTDQATIQVTDAPLSITAQINDKLVAFSYDWGRVADQVAWDFGDGQTGNDHAPSHTYAELGTYTVTLQVTADGITAEHTQRVELALPAPVIESRLDRTQVTFSYTWAATASSVHWDLGDGTTSSLESPVHDYPDGGYFDITLTVGASGAQRSATTTIEVPAYDPTIRTLQNGAQVRFDYSWGLTPTLVQWNLGDGTTSNEEAPTHVYSDLGTYMVTLTLDDGVIQRTATTTVIIDTLPLVVTVAPTSPRIFEATYVWVPDIDGTDTLWDFGDGTTSTERDGDHIFVDPGTYTVTLIVTYGSAQATWTSDPITIVEVKEPHVIVAIPDTGINPYHQMYYRPERVAHPCTYVEGIDCDAIKELRLTVGPDGGTFAQRVAADAAQWNRVQQGQWYWIPQTVFIAVNCESPYIDADFPDLDQCILDDSNMHGTGTTSSALMENPDALIAFKEGGSSIQPFVDAGLPVDIYSVSWGAAIPVAGVGGAYPFPAPVCSSPRPAGTLYVKSSGNEPGLSTTMDCGAGHPDIITVGGGYAQDNTQEGLAYKESDVVSYFCRPTAQTAVATNQLRPSYCGTSFSAPTVAGALSKVILELRRDSGYTGNMVGDYIDDTATITIHDIRDAMEQTASYDPDSQYPNAGTIPVNPVTPYMQWGWGFYDGLVADATIERLRDGTTAQTHSADAVAYLEAVRAFKWAYYGGDPEPLLATTDNVPA